MNEAILYSRRVLPEVSRTFALGIEGLREPLRDQVGVAYLVCRILDTVEDTSELDSGRRAALLDRAAVETTDPERWRDCARDVEALFSDRGLTGSDHDLCRHAGVVLGALHDLPATARDAMRESIREMGEGMAATVRRERTGEGLHLETLGDLERYCYYVAGTVGHLLTNLFERDRGSIRGERAARLRAHAVDFGLGLQVTNVIKGVVDDRARGVSYVPLEFLKAAGTDLQRLAEDPSHPAGRRVVAALVGRTLEWLDRANEYTVTVPASEDDIRRFCALPLLLALRTLGLAVKSDRVFGEESLKIGRDEVREIDEAIRRRSSQDEALRGLYEEERGRVAGGIGLAAT